MSEYYEWPHKYDIGNEVYYKGNQYYIYSITASSGSETYDILYGLATTMPGPYFSGSRQKHQVDERDKELMTPDKFKNSEIEAAKRFLLDNGVTKL